MFKGWIFLLVLAHPGSPKQMAIEGCSYLFRLRSCAVCVCLLKCFKNFPFYRAVHYGTKSGLVIACHLSAVCLSICVGDSHHIGWKSLKLITQTISPTSSLFVGQRSSTYSQGNLEKFWGENVRSTPTSITSGWIESTESHVVLDGGVAVCLLLSAHHAVIFAIAQLSCLYHHWCCWHSCSHLIM